jgi:hypothetical protein
VRDRIEAVFRYPTPGADELVAFAPPRGLCATVERDPRPQHLAEVILSGMLTAVPGPSGSCDFRPGVRELLLRLLPRTTRGRTR